MENSTHSIPELDRKGLRDFGLVTGAFLAALFGLLLPWLLERSFPIWPWALFALLAILGLAAPMVLRPVYRTWMRFGLLMGRIMTPVVLGLAFFVVIIPTALLKRLFGRDAMRRNFEASAKSYRVISKKPSKNSLEKPY